MASVSAGPARELAQSLREQLGIEAVVLITAGARTCAVAIVSAHGYQVHANSGENRDRDQMAGSASQVAGGRLAYSVAEAAAALGLSRDLIYHQMRVGRLSSVKVGRRRIITRQQIDTFLGSNA